MHLAPGHGRQLDFLSVREHLLEPPGDPLKSSPKAPKLPSPKEYTCQGTAMILPGLGEYSIKSSPESLHRCW